MTISDIMNLPDGGWINEPFTGAVVSAATKATKAGGTFWSGKLANPQFPSAQIAFTYFGDTPIQAGKVYNFQGQGMKKDSYKENPQITIGDKASVSMVGDAPADMPAPAPAAPKKAWGGGGGFKKAPPVVDPSNFHTEMRRMALFYCHCVEYGRDVESKVGAFPPEQFQAMVSSFFIEGNKKGLQGAAGALRSAQGSPQGPTPSQAAPSQPQAPQEPPVTPQQPELEPEEEDDVPF